MTASTLHKLAKYPHRAVFDVDPQEQLALRIRNPAGLEWQIIDRTLSLITGRNLQFDGQFQWDGAYFFGVTKRDYDLLGVTIAQIVEELQANGHEVVFENPDLANVSASILLTGSGDQNASNGDHLSGYTSLLWSIFDAYSIVVDQVKAASDEAIKQMVIPQSSGEWLDVWANLYGVPRNPSEVDADLQQRLPEEAFRVRVNGLGIEQAVKSLTGQTVSIAEPWKNIFALGVSQLSGADHMQDGQYWASHVIQPVGAEGTNWTGVLDIIRRNKASGVVMAKERIDVLPRHVDIGAVVPYTVASGRLDEFAPGDCFVNDSVLGVLRTSFTRPIINQAVAISEDWVITQPLGGFQSEQTILPYRSIAEASITLSDGVALGDVNGVLGRGIATVTFSPDPVPSETLFLSGYSAQETIIRVESISMQSSVFEGDSTFTAVGVVQRWDGRSYYSADAYPADTGWTVGVWDGRQWVPSWRIAGIAITSSTV